MRSRSTAAALIVVAALTMLGLVPSASARTSGPLREYVVRYGDGVSLAEGRAAVRAAGGKVVDEIVSIGAAKVLSRNLSFILDAAAHDAIAGAAQNRVIGYSDPALREKVDEVEALSPTSAARSSTVEVAEGAEPLAELQWGNEMIDATIEGSYASQPGSADVLVGIIDTGIDASHPDIAPNFDAALSRNFTVDDPLIDGPCNKDPDHSCQDPADVDEGGHGTHVAGTVAAAVNGLGISGIAPEVTLVNEPSRRAGLRFLLPVRDPRGVHVRGRQRHRRREHELLHGSVAVQLSRLSR
jgi:subtilisin family serine protease